MLLTNWDKIMSAFRQLGIMSIQNIMIEIIAIKFSTQRCSLSGNYMHRIISIIWMHIDF